MSDGAAKKAPTLDSLGDAYLRERLLRHEITQLTARNIRCTLYSLSRSFGARPVSRLSRTDIERWLATRFSKSAATRRGDLSHVKSFCLWLVRRGHVRVDPTAELPVIRVPQPPPPGRRLAASRESTSHRGPPRS